MADTERLLNKAQGDDIISALAQIAANILQVPSEKLIIDWSHSELPASGDDHTIYAIPTGDADDPWDFYVWNDVDEEWVQFDWTFAVDSALSTTSENPVQNKVVTTALGGKVDKVTGKGLSTNDYTNEEKALVATIPNKADADDVEGTKTVSGNPITLTDASETYAESLVVELEPKQDLHGQSAPYVGGAGKNKMPSGEQKTETSGNLTVTCDGNGHYTVNGTTGSNAEYVTFSCEEFTILDAENATLYLMNSATNSSVYFRFYNSGVMVDNFALTPTNRKVSYTTMKGATCKTFMIYVLANTTVNNLTLSPMICDNANETTFAPYSNICPITGYTECEVDDVGVNQWDEEWEVGAVISDGSVDASLTSRLTTSPIKIQPNTSYYQAGPDSILIGRYAYYDKSGNLLEYNFDGFRIHTFTTPQNAYFLRITFGSAYGTTYNHDISINYPSTVTTYQPYHSSNATIQFGQTVYGGRSNFTDGGTDSKFGNDNDISQLDWVVDNNDGLFRALVTSLNYKLLGILYCDRYKGVRKAASQMEYGEISATNSQSVLYLRIKDATAIGMDATQFKAHISGTQLTYELYESGELSTPPTDLKLLQGTNNLTTNGTTINLDYIPDNSIGNAVKASEEYTNRQVNREIEQHLEMPYLRILDNDVDTEIKNYQLYYRMIASAYTLVNLAEMLQHRFLFVEVIQNPSGTSNDKLLHSALIDPRTIDGFEYQMKAGTGDTVCIKTNIAENKLDLYVQSTGTHTSGDPTDYYVTIRMVD